jgi:hypothetical protein
MSVRVDVTVAINSSFFYMFADEVNQSEGEDVDSLRRVLRNENEYRPHQTVAYQRVGPDNTVITYMVIEDIGYGNNDLLMDLLSKSGIAERNYSAMDLSEGDHDVAYFYGGDKDDFNIDYSIKLDEHRDIVKNIYSTLNEDQRNLIIDSMVSKVYDGSQAVNMSQMIRAHYHQPIAQLKMLEAVDTFNVQPELKKEVLAYSLDLKDMISPNNPSSSHSPS